MLFSLESVIWEVYNSNFSYFSPLKIACYKWACVIHIWDFLLVFHGEFMKLYNSEIMLCEHMISMWYTHCSPPPPPPDLLQPASSRSPPTISLRIQFQEPFKAEMFKEAGRRDHLRPHGRLLQELLGRLSLSRPPKDCAVPLRAQDWERIWPRSKEIPLRKCPITPNF